MPREARLILRFATAGIQVGGEPAILEWLRFLYRDFEVAHADQDEAVLDELPLWVFRRDGEGWRLSSPGRQSCQAADAPDAVAWGDWCISSHLLGDLRPLPVALHAAAVLAPDGGTLLLVAPSGGGKSTLCGAFLARGCTLLGDELVPMARDSVHPLAYPRAIGLKPGAPALVISGPELRVQGRDGTYRWNLPERRLPPGAPGDPVRGIFLLARRDEGPVTLESLAPSRALSQLLGQVPMRAGDPGRTFEAVASLVSSVPTFSLRYSDATEAVERVLTDSLFAAAGRAPAVMVSP